MKKFLMCLCALAMVFGMVGTASAISYTDTRSFEGEDAYMRRGESVTWTHSLGDGFDPGSQDITSAYITLSLRDDGGRYDFFEFARLDVGENDFFWEVNTVDASFTITSLMTLSETGEVDITLTALWGDFYFDKATLYAEATNPDSGAAPVPEPSTILLMGTGILGLVAYGRKRYHEKVFKRA